MSNITTPPSPLCLGPTAMADISTMPIPQNINVFVRPGNDTANIAMTNCCAPSRVQIVDGCYIWCEIPKRYFNNTKDHGTISAEMSSCMRAVNRGLNDTKDVPTITGSQFNAAGRVGMVKGLGAWVLLVSGLVWAL